MYVNALVTTWNEQFWLLAYMCRAKILASSRLWAGKESWSLILTTSRFGNVQINVNGFMREVMSRVKVVRYTGYWHHVIKLQNLHDKIWKRQIMVLMPICELFHFHVILSQHPFPRGHPAEVITLVTFLIKLWSVFSAIWSSLAFLNVLYWDFHSKLIIPYLHPALYFPGLFRNIYLSPDL